MSVKFRLGLMMFLEYAVKGLWFPLASSFLVGAADKGGLGFTAVQKGQLIAIPFAIGALMSPFVGQLCDRRFATEKTLGVMLIATGILKIVTAHQTTFSAWLVLASLFAILYVPTVSLTNSLAMSHLRDAKSEFPRVRVWGTVGWIAVAWIFSWIWLQHDLKFQWLPPFLKGEDYPDGYARMIDALKVAGVVCIGYGIFCWFGLPHTPPAEKKEGQASALRRAAGLFRRPSFAVLLIISLAIAAVHTIYFIQMGRFLETAGLAKSQLAPAQSLGQFSEIAVMAMLGWFLTKLGFRWCIGLGALCYALRYFIFSQTGLPVEVYVIAQLLHGFCFAFFFAAAFVYVDRVAPKDIRHSAQTFYTVVMFGLGPLIATQLNKFLATRAETVDGALTLNGFSTYWNATAIIALVCAVLFVLFFRDETRDADKLVAEASAADSNS